MAFPGKEVSTMQASRPHTKPFIIPVFIPHAGCPHRCIFCNQNSTTGQTDTTPTIGVVRKTIAEFLGYRRKVARRTEISFYGGNFLGLWPEQIRLLLATATTYVREGQVDGIRFSTRPDTIDAERLALIAAFPVSTIEIGVQSMNDAVLQLSQRGHSAEDTRRALALLKRQPYRVGAQVMVGLPGDTEATALATARQVAELAPDFVRIYPTLVLRDSPLVRWYNNGRFVPLTLETAVALVAEVYRIFARHDITIVRMGLQAAQELSPQADLLAGPFHPAFGELVQSALWQEAISRQIDRLALQDSEVILDMPPRLISQIKGHRDAVLIHLIGRHQLRAVEVRTSDSIPQDTVLVNGQPCHRW
jgi:histone acetyltransferase (RNA polymerase elongator complex component)